LRKWWLDWVFKVKTHWGGDSGEEKSSLVRINGVKGGRDRMKGCPTLISRLWEPGPWSENPSLRTEGEEGEIKPFAGARKSRKGRQEEKEVPWGGKVTARRRRSIRGGRLED